MPPRLRLFFLVFTAALFLIPAVALVSELTRRSDIWWTPRTMIVPLGESKGRVEIYARGRLVDSLIQAGSLRIVSDGDTTVVRTGDIGLRFNNWDRVRGDRTPRLLIYAAMCGVLAVIFFMILTGRIAYRGEIDPPARQQR